MADRKIHCRLLTPQLLYGQCGFCDTLAYNSTLKISKPIDKDLDQDAGQGDPVDVDENDIECGVALRKSQGKES